MQRINHNIDQYINWNDPDSIENYCPEDQFEYVPDDPTLKDHVIYFLHTLPKTKQKSVETKSNLSLEVLTNGQSKTKR